MTMERRHHNYEEPFAVSAERMFELLITPSAIEDWWGASRAIVTAAKDGSWIATWGEGENDSGYTSSFKIKEFEPPRRLVLSDGKYVAKFDPPIEMNMTTEFIVEPMVGGCTLRVVHAWLPADEAAEEFYEACVIGWKNTFQGIRKYFYDNP